MTCRRLVQLGLAAFVSFGVGCQPDLGYKFAPVEGTVTRGGKPLANVVVAFYTDVEAGGYGPRSTGVTDAAGRYKLNSDKGDVGAVIGKHRVCLSDNEVHVQKFLASQQRVANKSKESSPPTALTKLADSTKIGEAKPRGGSLPPQLPLSYTRFQDTPLRAEVSTEGSVIDWAVP